MSDINNNENFEVTSNGHRADSNSNSNGHGNSYINSNGNGNGSYNGNGSRVNTLLQFEDEDEIDDDEPDQDSEDLDDDELEDPVSVQTKHSLVNSPYTRFGVVGGAFAIAFGTFFVLFNGTFNGGPRKEVAETPKPPDPKKLFAKSDGDVYAQLALAKQQTELEKLNKSRNGKDGKEEVKEPTKPTDGQPTTANPTKLATSAPGSAPPRQVRSSPPAEPPQPTRSYSPPPENRSRVLSVPPAPLPERSLRQALPPPPPPSTPAVTVATDPMAELERMRSVGNIGQISYAAQLVNATDTGNTSANASDDYTPRRSRSQLPTRPTASNSVNDAIAIPTSNERPVERLKPKWTPVSNVVNVSYNTTDNRVDNELKDIKPTGDYPSEEAGIIEGKQEQYLVVGSGASAILETPLVWSAPAATNSAPQTLSSQFVARLTEPIKSNTGADAIPAGTRVAIEMSTVDNSGKAVARVTAILKNGTEYPLSPDVISVFADGGKPLIANQYHDKGKDIFSMDSGLVVASGLAKVGEIINQPNTQSSVSQSGGVFSSSTSTSSNNNPSKTGAFLQGAFGALSDQIKQRNQRTLEEIYSRPNVWFVPKGTRILIVVNKSIQL